MSDFTARVLSVVRRIPVGRVATYGDVAAAAGSPRASRAVGNIMRDVRRAATSPAHRVVAAAGRLGGYGGNLELKRALLRAEGLDRDPDGIRDFRERRWPGRMRRWRPQEAVQAGACRREAAQNAAKSRGLPRASGQTGESRGEGQREP